MLVLALESATETAAVALADEAGVIVSAEVCRGRHHAESITPSIEFVCTRAGVSMRSITGICVDVGPGLFTGLRVGIATAKALGFALGVPVVAAGSLEVLAGALAGTGCAPGSLLIPVVDAKRGEVFCARFRVTGEQRPADRAAEHMLRAPGGSGPGVSGPAGSGQRGSRPGVVQVEGDCLRTPQDLARSLSLVHERFVLAGDGALRYAEIFFDIDGATVASEQLASPPVQVLAMLGVARLSAGAGMEHPGEVPSPRYLREADTRINWEQRLPRLEPSRTVS